MPGQSSPNAHTASACHLLPVDHLQSLCQGQEGRLEEGEGRFLQSQRLGASPSDHPVPSAAGLHAQGQGQGQGRIDLGEDIAGSVEGHDHSPGRDGAARHSSDHNHHCHIDHMHSCPGSRRIAAEAHRSVGEGLDDRLREVDLAVALQGQGKAAAPDNRPRTPLLPCTA